MKQILAPVISNNEVMPQTHLIWLECPDIVAEAKPGQFVMVNCGENCYLPRPLSTHQTDGEKLALLFEIVGKGTKWLSQRKPGDSVDIFGPLGNGFTIRHGSKNLLLVSGGMGIAALQFMEDRAISDGYIVKPLNGAATASQLYQVRPTTVMPYGTSLTIQPAAATQYGPPVTVQPASTTEDGSTGIKGIVTDLLTPEIIEWADQIFACGPVGMYQAMAQMPELINKPVQVSLEMRMACGVGVCYSCTIKTRSGLKQVCKDGPVFNLEDIIWEETEGV